MRSSVFGNQSLELKMKMPIALLFSLSAALQPTPPDIQPPRIAEDATIVIIGAASNIGRKFIEDVHVMRPLSKVQTHKHPSSSPLTPPPLTPPPPPHPTPTTHPNSLHNPH